MKVVTRRRALALAILPVVGLAVLGCGSEVREQTQTWRQSLDGVNATAGSVKIRNAVVVADPATGQATVLATFANGGSEPDTLADVVVDGVSGQPETGPLDVPARGFASLGPDHTRLDVSRVSLEPGLLVDIEFIFAVAPRANVQAVVQENSGIYADAIAPATNE